MMEMRYATPRIKLFTNDNLNDLEERVNNFLEGTDNELSQYTNVTITCSSDQDRSARYRHAWTACVKYLEF